MNTICVKYLVGLIFCIAFTQVYGQYQDCTNAQILCSKDSVVVQSVTGPGNFENVVANSCFQDQEHQSHWFTFYATKSGTFEFSIRAKDYLADYDFAFWEGGCPGFPGSKVVACNWLGGIVVPPYYATGVSDNPLATFGEGSNVEFINTITITAGKVYYLLVDNITNNGVGFTLRFGGTGSIGNPVLTYTAGIFCNQTSEDLKSIKVVGLDSVAGSSEYFTKYLDAINGTNKLINTVINQSANYYVTKTTPHGCKSTQTINVTLENPDVVIKDVYTCGNPKFDLKDLKISELSGIDISTLSFTYFNSQQELLNNTNPFTNSITQSGTYWAKAVTNNGCSDAIPFNVNLDKPLMSLTGTVEICPGDPVLLPIVYNGQWPLDLTVSINGTSTIQDFLIKGEPVVLQPQKTTVYTIGQAVDTTGCKADVSGSFKVIVHEKPEIASVVTDCSKFQGIPILIVTLKDGDTLSYKISGINGSFNGNIFTSDQLVDGNAYSIDVSDKYQCGVSQWSGTVSCNCDPTFAAQIIETKALDCAYSNNGAIKAQVTGGVLPISYLWNNGSKSTDLQGLVPGNFSVTITDGNGCTVSDELDLIAPPAIQMDQVISPVSCNGLSDGEIEITQVSGGTGKLECTLNGQTINGPPFISSNLASGNYSGSIVDSKLCKLDFSVFVPEGENFVVSLGQDIIAKEGDNIQINLLGDLSNLDLVSWQGDYDIDCQNCTQLDLVPTKSGFISFSAVSKNGCTASDTLFVKFKLKSLADKIFIPNSFSPNGDGVNDYFKPYFGDIGIRKSTMNIYNRWGSLIFSEEFVDDTKGWNGRFGSKILNPDVFVYLITVEDVNGEIYSFKGDVQIYR